MQRRVVRFEVEKNERQYTFDCETESPMGEVFDVLCEMQQNVLQKMKEMSPKREENPEEDPEKEPEDN